MNAVPGTGMHRDFPYTTRPTGWFQLGWSPDFPTGTTVPLHFFGTIGALGMATGSGMALWLLVLKILTGQHIMAMHGPIFVIAGVLILAGIQMMGIGLLGELQVRHFYTASHRAPYAVDRILRLRSEESLLQ